MAVFDWTVSVHEQEDDYNGATVRFPCTAGLDFQLSKASCPGRILLILREIQVG